MLQGRIGRIDGYLVVRFVTMGHGQVVVLQINVKVWQDQLILDACPDDPGHLVPIHLNDGSLYTNLAHDVISFSGTGVGETTRSVRDWCTG